MSSPGEMKRSNPSTPQRPSKTKKYFRYDVIMRGSFMTLRTNVLQNFMSSGNVHFNHCISWSKLYTKSQQSTFLTHKETHNIKASALTTCADVHRILRCFATVPWPWRSAAAEQGRSIQQIAKGRNFIVFILLALCRIEQNVARWLTGGYTPESFDDF